MRRRPPAPVLLIGSTIPNGLDTPTTWCAIERDSLNQK
jgi:hypothetical protein